MENSRYPNQENKPHLANRLDVTMEFRNFFLDELRDIYGAEKALVDALPELQDQTFATRLTEAIRLHLNQTKIHVQRLEQVFHLLGEDPESKTCKAMNGLVDEAYERLSNTDEDLIRDAGIILAAQKIEHYEIATYGTLIAFAKTMGQDGIAKTLEETLEEEKKADQT